MKIVVISAGHSLSDPGAVYSPNARENFMTIELSRLASDILRKHSIGVLNVSDNLDLVNTIKWINARAKEQKINLCVELHCNSSGDQKARGVEAWYYHNFQSNTADEDSKKLSQCLVDAVAIESGMPVRGIFDESTNRWGRLGFVHDTDPLASLLECGFLSNEQDRSILLSETGRMNIAKGIARGILTYLGEAWKPELLMDKESASTEDAKDKQINDLKSALESTKKDGAYKLAEQKKLCQDKMTAIKRKLSETIDLLD